MISRQKLIEELEERRSHMITESDGRHVVSIEKVIDYISEFPPADVPDTNVGEWIPCSEGTLPANGRTVPVTNEVSQGKRYMTTATYYTKKDVVDDYEWTGEGFYQYDSEYGYGRLHNVVAWLNVEPYKVVE